MYCLEYVDDSPEYLLEQQQKKEILTNRPFYSPPVRMGNWNEDLFMEEEKARVAGYKRKHCQLLIQKTRKMLKNLLRGVDLQRETPFVMYECNYQIQACDLPNQINAEWGSQTSYGLYLSGLMNERDIDVSSHFIHGCGLSVSPDKEPCVRNTFVFVGCSGQTQGQTVYHGDEFYIKIYETGTDGHLFLQCENPTIDDFGGHLALRLTQSPDIYCKFKISHWNPNYRYETVGTGVTPDTRIIIQHVASGRNVAIEYPSLIPTFFGIECLVSCHTYRDTHKMETARNFWKILCKREPDKNLYVRAAKGEDIPIDMLN